jgi:drug/metabolite transporter (DMT)-like permease
VAFALWFYGLTTCGPARVGALLYLEPFVTSGVSLLLLGEPMTARTLAGAAAVFAGVWMVGHGVIDVAPSRTATVENA